MKLLSNKSIIRFFEKRKALLVILLISFFSLVLGGSALVKKADAAFSSGFCTYDDDNPSGPCNVNVKIVTNGFKQGYVLSNAKWYYCIQAPGEVGGFDLYSCISQEPEDPECTDEIEGQTYVDSEGDGWTCTTDSRGNYYWFSAQTQEPKCNAKNVGRLWYPGESGLWFKCVQQADGSYDWVLIQNPFGPTPTPNPSVTLRFSPNPGIVIVDEVGDGSSNKPSIFRWNAGSGAGIVNNFKIFNPDGGGLIANIAANSSTTSYAFDTMPFPSITSFKVNAYTSDNKEYYIGTATLPNRESMVNSMLGNMAIFPGKNTYGTSSTSHQFSWYNGDSSITKFEIRRNGILLTTLAPKPLGFQDYTDSTLPRPASTIPAKYYYSVVAYKGSTPKAGQSQKYEFIVSTVPSKPQQLATIMYDYYCPNPGVGLSWRAADDDGGVTGYNIYRDGVKVATAPPSRYSSMVAPGYDDTAVRCPAGSEYATFIYSVSAVDSEGNESPRSDVFTVNATPYSPPSYGGGDGGDW